MDKSYFDKKTNTYYCWPENSETPIASLCLDDKPKVLEIKDNMIIKQDSEGTIIMNSDGAIMIDKYGQALDTRNGKCCFTPNNKLPTYDELYKHWLKTKDKPKRKRKSANTDPLPGQVSIFDATE